MRTKSCHYVLISEHGDKYGMNLSSWQSPPVHTRHFPESCSNILTFQFSPGSLLTQWKRLPFLPAGRRKRIKTTCCTLIRHTFSSAALDVEVIPFMPRWTSHPSILTGCPFSSFGLVYVQVSKAWLPIRYQGDPKYKRYYNWWSTCRHPIAQYHNNLLESKSACLGIGYYKE